MSETLSYTQAFKLCRSTAMWRGAKPEDAEDFAAEFALNHLDPEFKLKINRRYIDFYRKKYGDKRRQGKNSTKEPKNILPIEKCEEVTEPSFEFYELPKIEPERTMYVLFHAFNFRMYEIGKMFKRSEATVSVKLKAYQKIIEKSRSGLLDV